MVFTKLSLPRMLKNTTSRLIVIIVTIFYVTFFLFWQSNNLDAVDPIPTILQLDPKAINRTSQVEVGLHINNFQQFSIQNNEFTLDGIVWFKFPIGSEALKTVSDFSFNNSFLLYSGQTVYKYPPIIKLIGNNVLVSYHIIITFKSNLNYHHFPLGGHIINLELQNKNATPYEFYFVSKKENLTLNDDIFVTDFKPISLQVKTGYKSAELSNQQHGMEISYPTTVFSITFINLGIRDLISLYFPMLVLFFIALFCLLLDVTDASRLSYAATAVPILVLFRMVIDAVSPKIGYSTHIDYIYYLLVFLSMLILLLQTYVILVLHRAKMHSEKISDGTKQHLERTNDIAFFIILLLLIVLVTYSYFR